MALALELKDRVDVINNLVGNDRKAIPNVLKSLKSEKKRLETKVKEMMTWFMYILHELYRSPFAS
jgi:hypothetical protein